jgi:hypothetical protein
VTEIPCSCLRHQSMQGEATIRIYMVVNSIQSMIYLVLLTKALMLLDATTIKNSQEPRPRS